MISRPVTDEEDDRLATRSRDQRPQGIRWRVVGCEIEPSDDAGLLAMVAASLRRHWVALLWFRVMFESLEAMGVCRARSAMVAFESISVVLQWALLDW